MPLSTQQRDAHFERYAEDVGEILRAVGRQWGGLEQIDEEEQDILKRSRFALGYAYPKENQHGYVYGVFWYGKTVHIAVSDDGKLVDVNVPIGVYRCATIKIAIVDDHDHDDFRIDDTHNVHSLGELKDRINVMWHANEWGLKSEHIVHNAALYHQFVAQEARFKAHMKVVALTLKKIGNVWGGEEQTNNTPDAEDSKSGLGGLFGGASGGKKRFYVGFAAPQFELDQAGKARLAKVGVWLDLWEGKKGHIRSTETGRGIVLPNKSLARILVAFPPDADRMVVSGVPDATAKTGDEMKLLLADLWKRDAFDLRQ